MFMFTSFSGALEFQVLVPLQKINSHVHYGLALDAPLRASLARAFRGITKNIAYYPYIGEKKNPFSPYTGFTF